MIEEAKEELREESKKKYKTKIKDKISSLLKKVEEVKKLDEEIKKLNKDFLDGKELEELNTFSVGNFTELYNNAYGCIDGTIVYYSGTNGTNQ